MTSHQIEWQWMLTRMMKLGCNEPAIGYAINASSVYGHALKMVLIFGLWNPVNCLLLENQCDEVIEGATPESLNGIVPWVNSPVPSRCTLNQASRSSKDWFGFRGLTENVRRPPWQQRLTYQLQRRKYCKIPWFLHNFSHVPSWARRLPYLGSLLQELCRAYGRQRWRELGAAGQWTRSKYAR